MKHLKLFILALLLCMAGTTIAQTSQTYVKDVMLIGSDVHSEANSLRDYYVSQGWTFVDQDLNAGCGSGSYWIYLLYKAETSPGINLGYITDFYITNADNPVDDSFVAANGHTYHIAPCDGNEHFVEIKGDLNCGVGGSADIHLYYTKERFTNNRAVTNIWFNDTKAGGVGLNGDNSEGYDLNKGCGSGSDYIYMHISTAVADTEFTSDNLRYSINPDYTSVTVESHYYGSSAAGPLILPESVSYGGHNFVVNAIGASAFAGCSGLTGTLTIPNTVTTIGDEAFYGCYGFQGDLTIPNSVTTIGTMAFWDCHGFTGTLTIPNSVTTIGVSAFYGCYGFTGALTIPNSMSTIEASAFAGCSGFDSLTIPNSVTAIGYYAFYGCNGFMGDLTLPESLITIGASAFYGCSSFTGTLTLPSSLTTIGPSAFENCTGFDDIFSHATTPPTLGSGVFDGWNTNTTTVFVPSGSVDDYSSIQWGGFTHFEASSCEVESLIYTLNDDLETVTLTGHVDGTNATGELIIPDSVLYQGNYYAVTTIGNNAFYQCDGFSGSLSVPNSVTTIGNNAFYQCFGFTGSLTIGNSVTTIGRSAFEGCSNFTGSLTIGNSVTTIGEFAFYNCSGFTGSLTIPNSVTTIGNGAFEYCNGFTGSLTIPNSVTTIGEDAFYVCTGFTGSLTIPNSVTTIGNSAFEGCNGFTGSLTIPNSVTTIGSRAFYNCYGFTGSLVIPNSVTTIGNGAFVSCNGFTGSLTIPNSVTTIGEDVFCGCSGFTGSLVIPNSVTTIGSHAFRGCNGFTGSLTIGNSVTTIGGFAFYECTGFTSIESLAFAPPVLGNYVFFGWDTTTPVNVPCGSSPAYSSISWGGFSNFIEDCHNDIVAHAQYYPYPDNSDSPYTVAYWDIELTDDFETGDFSKSPWQMDALYPWVICDTVSHSGTYCMRSGNIGQNSTASTMTVTMNIPKDGMISFYAKISCEDPWDKGYFYIDDVQKGSWTGEIDYWMECQYPITAGQHTFLWKYEKDISGENGDDCFYIDDIVFYRIAPPTVPCDPSAAPSTDLFDVYRAKADGTDLTLLAEDYNSHYYVDSTWVNLPHESNYKYGITYANDTLFVWSNLLHTELDIPQNLVTPDDKVFNDEQITISWVAINATALQKYNVYRDGYKIGETTTNTYTDGPLAYNMQGYVYYVTAVYDEMDESAPSNTVNVKVSGYGNVNGHAFEQDGVTGIAGATVTLTGNDEFGGSHTFDFTTDNNGYYSGQIYAGSYNGQASHDDYLTTNEPVQGNPVVIHYNQTTSPIDFMMDDLWIENGVNITVFLNSADSPEGVHVVLTQDSIQASLNPMGDDELEIILDETGYYVWEQFRKGTYYVEISMEGYETILDTMTISTSTGMMYVMTEILYSPKDVYVSRTGWASWQPGDRHFEAYKVVLTDLDDHSLYTENVSTNALQLPTDSLVDNTLYKLKVANLYSTGQSEYVECNWLYTSCDHFEGFSEITGTVSPEGVNLNWTYPDISVGEPMAVSLFIDGEWQGFVNGNSYYDAQGTINSQYEVRVVYNGDTLCPNNNIDMSMSCLQAVPLQYLEYTVTATANPTAGGTITGAGTYDHGTTVNLTATANTGYTFTNWTQGGTVVSTDATYSFVVTQDTTFVANFSLNSHEVAATANPTAGGTVTGAGTYDHGATVNLTATANTGYTFTNWTQGGTVVSTDATYSFVVTQDTTFVANFSLNSHEVAATANPTAGGTVTGAGTYDHGATVNLTATANTGYTFTNWTQGGTVVSTDATYSFTVTQDTTFVANFTLNTYEITAWANPNTGGEVSGAGTYDYGTMATLTVTTNEGYLFTHWTKDGVEVSTTPTYTFTVTESAAFVANFDQIVTQSFPFTEGWNWMSTYVEQEGFNGLQALQAGLGENGVQIKSQMQFCNNYGVGWVGNLTVMDNESSYQVLANSACTVEMTGSLSNPADHPITVSPGWTWIGYPVGSSMSVTEAFAGIAVTTGDMLKTQNDGYASYLEGYGWYGSLNTLNPGMGMMYKSNNDTNITLTYPNGGAKDNLRPNQTPESNHWQPNLNAYADNMSVMAVVELDGGELVPEPVEGSAQYELAAFANGECRGSVHLLYVEPIHRYMAFLTIAGDEADELQFGLYDVTTGEEHLTAEEHLIYTTNAVVGTFEEPFVLHFRSGTGMDEWANNVYLYPNPVEHGQKVSIGSDVETGEMQVEIVNALGAVVETLSATSLQTITAPNVAGVYTLRLTVEGKGTCYRKLVVR